MSVGAAGMAVLHQFGGMEFVIFLIVVGILLLFGPSKLPELARSVGRAWGEFRKGKMEVEREIRQEFLMQEGGAEILASKDQVLRVARELVIPTEGRDLKDIKLDVARMIDRVDGPRVVSIAKMFAIPVEGIGVQTIKEQVIRHLGV